MRACDFSQLKLSKKATLDIKNIRYENGNTVFEITADRFAHAVHFDLPVAVKLSDNYFDLFAGQTKQVTVYGKTLDSVGADSVYLK